MSEVERKGIEWLQFHPLLPPLKAHTTTPLALGERLDWFLLAVLRSPQVVGLLLILELQ